MVKRRRSLMKTHLITTFLLTCLSLLSAHAQASRIFTFPSAYWYSTDIFSKEIYIGNIEIIGRGKGPAGEKKLQYRFKIKEVLTPQFSEQARFKVGDVFQSETFRAINNKLAVICLSSYPDPGETVVDGGFPLMLSENVEKTLKLIQKHGVDLYEYPDAAFEEAVKLAYNSEQYRFLRKKRSEQTGADQPATAQGPKPEGDSKPQPKPEGRPQ